MLGAARVVRGPVEVDGEGGEGARQAAAADGRRLLALPRHESHDVLAGVAEVEAGRVGAEVAQREPAVDAALHAARVDVDRRLARVGARVLRLVRVVGVAARVVVVPAVVGVAVRSRVVFVDFRRLMVRVIVIGVGYAITRLVVGGWNVARVVMVGEVVSVGRSRSVLRFVMMMMMMTMVVTPAADADVVAIIHAFTGIVVTFIVMFVIAVVIFFVIAMVIFFVIAMVIFFVIAVVILSVISVAIFFVIAVVILSVISMVIFFVITVVIFSVIAVVIFFVIAVVIFSVIAVVIFSVIAVMMCVTAVRSVPVAVSVSVSVRAVPVPVRPFRWWAVLSLAFTVVTHVVACSIFTFIVRGLAVGRVVPVGVILIPISAALAMFVVYSVIVHVHMAVSGICQCHVAVIMVCALYRLGIAVVTVFVSTEEAIEAGAGDSGGRQ